MAFSFIYFKDDAIPLQQWNFLLRINSYQEAKGYFDSVQSIIEQNSDLFDDTFKAYNSRRKQGQSLQHKGQFSETKKILTQLIEEKELGDKPNAQADIGLIEVAFDRLEMFYQAVNPKILRKLCHP